MRRCVRGRGRRAKGGSSPGPGSTRAAGRAVKRNGRLSWRGFEERGGTDAKALLDQFATFGCAVAPHLLASSARSSRGCRAGSPSTCKASGVSEAHSPPRGRRTSVRRGKDRRRPVCWAAPRAGNCKSLDRALLSSSSSSRSPPRVRAPDRLPASKELHVSKRWTAAGARRNLIRSQGHKAVEKGGPVAADPAAEPSPPSLVSALAQVPLVPFSHCSADRESRFALAQRERAAPGSCSSGETVGQRRSPSEEDKHRRRRLLVLGSPTSLPQRIPRPLLPRVECVTANLPCVLRHVAESERNGPCRATFSNSRPCRGIAPRAVPPGRRAPCRPREHTQAGSVRAELARASGRLDSPSALPSSRIRRRTSSRRARASKAESSSPPELRSFVVHLVQLPLPLYGPPRPRHSSFAACRLPVPSLEDPRDRRRPPGTAAVARQDKQSGCSTCEGARAGRTSAPSRSSALVDTGTDPPRESPRRPRACAALELWTCATNAPSERLGWARRAVCRGRGVEQGGIEEEEVESLRRGFEGRGCGASRCCGWSGGSRSVEGRAHVVLMGEEGGGGRGEMRTRASRGGAQAGCGLAADEYGAAAVHLADARLV